MRFNFLECYCIVANPTALYHRMVALSIGGDNIYFRRIKDLRIDNDLTQQNIADYLGCKREVYRRYETGIRTIPVDFLIKLADLYGESVDYLLEHTPKKNVTVSRMIKQSSDTRESKNK